MATCPSCGGTVQDNVCTNCGTAVWPQGATGGEAGTPPPPPSSPAPSSSDANPMAPTPSASSPGPTPPATPGSSPGSVPPPPPGDDWQSTSEGSGGSTGSSKKTLWWVLGGIGILVVLGIGAVFLLFNLMGLSPSDIERAGQGSPERLAELRSDCDAGDMEACDDLYLESPVGSDDEDFGDTCGGRNEPAGWCVDVHGETTDPNP